MENCPKDPNIRPGYDVKEEVRRIKDLNKDKKVIKDTLDEIVKLLRIAATTKGNNSGILSKAALMFGDFNYQNFNSNILSGFNEENDDENTISLKSKSNEEKEDDKSINEEENGESKTVQL